MHQLGAKFPVFNSALFRQVRSQDSFFPKTCSSPRGICRCAVAGVAAHVGVHSGRSLALSTARRLCIADSLWFPARIIKQLETVREVPFQTVRPQHRLELSNSEALSFLSSFLKS